MATLRFAASNWASINGGMDATDVTLKVYNTTRPPGLPQTALEYGNNWASPADDWIGITAELPSLVHLGDVIVPIGAAGGSFAELEVHDNCRDFLVLQEKHTTLEAIPADDFYDADIEVYSNPGFEAELILPSETRVITNATAAVEGYMGAHLYYGGSSVSDLDDVATSGASLIAWVYDNSFHACYWGNNSGSGRYAAQSWLLFDQYGEVVEPIPAGFRLSTKPEALPHVISDLGDGKKYPRSLKTKLRENFDSIERQLLNLEGEVTNGP